MSRETPAPAWGLKGAGAVADRFVPREVATGTYKPTSSPAFLFENEAAPSVIRGWHRPLEPLRRSRICGAHLPVFPDYRIEFT